MSGQRWENVKRPYTELEVQRLRGSLKIAHTLAETGSKQLWADLMSEDRVTALGALTGNQALQQARAGLKAIYMYGWQIAADANVAGQMYPDMSLYPVNSAPAVVRAVNNAFQRADQIATINGDKSTNWFVPIVADAEAGFGGNLNAFELMKAMIEAGAAGVHFEDQLSSAKKCGHLGGKVVVPTGEFINKLVAARLAADVADVPTVIIARTDVNAARLLTSDVDDRDKPFTTGERTSEGFYRFTGGLKAAIARGVAYAPYCDLIWCETSNPNLEEAKKFADGVHKEHPGKMLAYNCFSRNTKFVTDNGVKSFENFENGDQISVLSHKNRWQKATVKSYGKQFLNEVIFTKGNKNSVPQKILATDNHRWLLTDGTETTQLKEGDKVLSVPSSEIFNYDNAEPFEKLYWCYGYVYGDGTKWKKNDQYKGSMVRLCKRDSAFAYRFEEMGFKTSTNLSLDGDFFAYTGSYLKTLPNINKDKASLLKAFTSGWLEADGAKVFNSNGKRYKSIQTTGKQNIEFLKKVLPMCGFYITRIEDYSDQITNFGRRTDVTKRINISNNKSKYGTPWSVRKINKKISEDYAWCLEVEEDHSFVLPNGIVTGNCSPSFKWKKHLDDATIAKFQTELYAMGYKFQFITLAGFHALNMSMFELASAYRDNGMSAYVELQEKEFANEPKYQATAHQQFVGTGYFDAVLNTITESETTAMKGSTENEQFTA